MYVKVLASRMYGSGFSVLLGIRHLRESSVYGQASGSRVVAYVSGFRATCPARFVRCVHVCIWPAGWLDGRKEAGREGGMDGWMEGMCLYMSVRLRMSAYMVLPSVS